jgi:hypothetical protein
MLTTGQENAVRSWVELAILGCPELAPIPLAKIVWSEQDFPEEARPYALIRYSGSTEEGATPSQIVNDSEELETTTHDETTVSITIVTKPSDAAPTREQAASSYVRELRARSRSFVAGILSQAQLAVRRVDVVPNVARRRDRPDPRPRPRDHRDPRRHQSSGDLGHHRAANPYPSLPRGVNHASA